MTGFRLNAFIPINLVILSPAYFASVKVPPPPSPKGPRSHTDQEICEINTNTKQSGVGKRHIGPDTLDTSNI